MPIYVNDDTRAEAHTTLLKKRNDSVNYAHPANRVHYRERSTDHAYKKGRVLSVRVDEDMLQKLTELRKLLATRIGVRETTMSTALAYCIATANAS